MTHPLVVALADEWVGDAYRDQPGLRQLLVGRIANAIAQTINGELIAFRRDLEIGFEIADTIIRLEWK